MVSSMGWVSIPQRKIFMLSLEYCLPFLIVKFLNTFKSLW